MSFDDSEDLSGELSPGPSVREVLGTARPKRESRSRRHQLQRRLTAVDSVLDKLDLILDENFSKTVISDDDIDSWVDQLEELHIKGEMDDLLVMNMHVLASALVTLQLMINRKLSFPVDETTGQSTFQMPMIQEEVTHMASMLAPITRVTNPAVKDQVNLLTYLTLLWFKYQKVDERGRRLFDI